MSHFFCFFGSSPIGFRPATYSTTERTIEVKQHGTEWLADYKGFTNVLVGFVSCSKITSSISFSILSHAQYSLFTMRLLLGLWSKATWRWMELDPMDGLWEGVGDQYWNGPFFDNYLTVDHTFISFGAQFRTQDTSSILASPLIYERTMHPISSQTCRPIE